MAVSSRFQDNGYVNWIKAGKALICTAEGIYDLCDDKIKNYHLALHQQFPRQPCNGPCQVQSLCSACATRHSNWEQDIRSQLTAGTDPYMPNSDTSQWDSEAWEIAKIFLGPGQQAFRAGGGDTIALVQLVLNCQLFSSSIANRQSFVDVKEIRSKLFRSADLKLTNTELKDHIKAMTTLLEDPTQLKNDAHAMQAVLQLQQIEADPLQPNDRQVLQHERLLWKQKIECISQDQSLSRQQLNNVIGFVTAQNDLNSEFQVEIDSLNARVDSERIRLDGLQEQHTELSDSIATLEMSVETSREHSTDQAQPHVQQDQVYSRITAMEEAVDSIKQDINEKLQHLKQQLRNVQKRRIETYLREKGYNENITINNLSDIYVEPLVNDVEHSRQIKVEELFSPDPFSHEIPLKVLLSGPGGIGKTMAALSLLSMWVDGRLPTIENLFFFSMRDLSRTRKCSLTDLLFTHQGIQKPNDDIVAEYMANMSQNLVIFEDFGDVGLYTSELESEPIRDDTEVDVSKLVGSIICGKTMPTASVLVTARDGGVIEYRVFDRKAEIRGFDESRIGQYVSIFCEGNDTENGNLKSHILNCIDDILVGSFCYVPMFCNLICRIAKMIMEQQNRMSLPTTITQLLTMSVLSFVMEHHPDFKGKTLSEDEDVIAHLKDPLLHHSKLAKEGMSHLPVKYLFSEDDLGRWGLSKVIARQFSLLMVCRDEAHGSVPREKTELHYFVHLIMQEFLAAIGLISNVDEIETLMANTSNLGQLDLVLTFISGLTGDPANIDFLESLGCQTTMTPRDLLRLIVKQDIANRRRDFKKTILLLLMLVSESRQPDLWATITAFVLNHRTDGKELNLANTDISPVVMQALIYVMPKMDDVTMLNMENCSIRGTNLIAGLRLLTQLTHLSLNGNKELHGREVTTVLSSSLKELVHLEELRLNGCRLTDMDAFELSSALLTLKRLMLLDLSGNSIGDIGACQVTEAVCTLPRLVYFGLSYNWLSENCVNLVRRTVHWKDTRGQERVQLAGMDWQRPPGQELYNPDKVVSCEHEVANLTTGLSRLLGRHVSEREWFWGQEVVKIEGQLAVAQDALRLAQAKRDGTTGTWGDNDIRRQQLRRRLEALTQDRPQ